ncbi:MAG: dihydrolipoamide succinyltransferase, partial [Spirochaetia bacterium]|nr:dihydrolipoamide succinyltransferase [Spirochaetia bacterium]
MKIEVKVPAAGESVTEAEIASWRKSNGDYVERDEVLLEVETDKATMEVRAESAGILSIQSPAGSTVKVGAVIASIET